MSADVLMAVPFHRSPRECSWSGWKRSTLTPLTHRFASATGGCLGKSGKDITRAHSSARRREFVAVEICNEEHYLHRILEKWMHAMLCEPERVIVVKRIEASSAATSGKSLSWRSAWCRQRLLWQIQPQARHSYPSNAQAFRFPPLVAVAAF